MKFYSSVATPELPHANHLYTLNTEAFCIDVDPIDRCVYRAVAEVAALGSLTIARVDSNAAVVTRKNDVRSDASNKHYSIIVAERGEVMISHHLCLSELKTGDFILMDNSYARTMFVYQQVLLLIISIPVQVLRRYIPLPDEIEAQKLSALVQNGVEQRPFYEPLLTLWEALKKSQLKEFAPTLSEKLLNNISALYTTHIGRDRSQASKRITQAKIMIEEQLANPELTVKSLAASLSLSSRYLRGLFSRSEKISHYILRRRLEECANQLTNVLLQNVPITAIAFKYGFNSTAHFSRTFRKQYGVTPREYRKQQLRKTTTAVD